MAALDLVEAERERYVAANCGDDEFLRNEVRWMLEAAEATVGTTLPRLVVESAVVGSTVNTAASSSGYRILRQLGEGGGGVVYLAERALGEGTPDELRQQVAIKFLHTKGVPGREPLKRFAEERRILATLNHPNIAHLIDGGTTSDGRSFLALEYVQGERIDRWCEHRQLPLRERVALFLKVCSAVHYAHQRLVIHRDLKPGNILVTDEGEPKLLDFGIARLLDHVGGVAASQTRTDMRTLTLAYASPEQLRGRPLGTSADVWSLGVVLYQLVCGMRPFGDEEEVSPVSLSLAIDTGKLLPPSRRLRQSGGATPLRREVPADLDAIVMKALRRDPCDRYAGVDALADDLQRFLSARPVRARHGAAWYRARLYLRRHAVGTGMLVLVLVLLGSFTVQRMQQVRRLELERDKTTAIAGFLQNLFENADPTHAHGSNITVREVLDRGAATLMSRHDIAPPVRVSLLLSMGRSYNQLGLGGQAIPLLREARKLQNLYGAGALERGQVLAALGRAYSTVINLAAAVPLDREALELLAQAPGDHAGEILRVRINLLYNELGGPGMPAAAVARETRQILARLDADPSSDRELHLQAQAVLAMAQGATGDGAGSIASAQAALGEARRLYAQDDPALVYYRFVLALVSMRHDPAGAMQLFRRSMADYDRQVGSVGPSMSGMLTYFGIALAQAGDLPDARDALERSAKLAQSFAEVSPDFELYTVTELARVYVAMGRTADAAALLQPRLAQLDLRAGTGLPWAEANRVNALVALGEADLARGDAASATRDFGAAMAQMGAKGARDMPEAWAGTLAGLGEAALLDQRLDRAGQWLAQLVEFNRAGKAAPADPGVAAATLLDARLRQARNGAGIVAELAGRAHGTSSQNGDCRATTAAPAVASSPPSCHDPAAGSAGKAAEERGAEH
ncbi:serine/threonine-protein kinase [Rhodanobacter sp. DHB23]|uniref:serine/threonine-protein kinase n=1 Tax=Rhodanobacter sp. DHB23 TaxID=2775923 RepID=UPI00177B8E7D|nr:serine/threonine-protein kinase [Rhodanobacter sp. DHB23]MBD8872966.1 protein kinase [Rhodanobacter sp. DHB23]